MTDFERPGDNPALVDAATVEVDGVSKWFGQKVAVSGLSCSFGPGVTGLLGPNGAGKTTLLRMLTGLAVPSEGRVTVLGFEPRKEPKVYASLALVPEESAVYDDLTAFELVRYAARLSGRPDPDADARKAIATVELEEDADRKVGEFSKGMRQRAKVAAALANDPLVLVLDEPLNGTDPVQRARLISLFRSLGDQGRTVIVSSHILQEVERMTDRVIAMVDGKLAAAGDITAIRAAMAHIPYRVVVDADDVRGLGSALIRGDGVSGVRLEDGRLHVETTSLRVLGTDVPVAAKELGVRLTGFHPEDDSLESVFRYLVSKRSYPQAETRRWGPGVPHRTAMSRQANSHETAMTAARDRHHPHHRHHDRAPGPGGAPLHHARAARPRPGGGALLRRRPRQRRRSHRSVRRHRERHVLRPGGADHRPGARLVQPRRGAPGRDPVVPGAAAGEPEPHRRRQGARRLRRGALRSSASAPSPSTW